MIAGFGALPEAAREARFSLIERIAMHPPAVRAAFLRSVPARLRTAWLIDWMGLARDLQLPPEDAEQDGAAAAWRVWLIMAGRGFGKTLAGAQWVHGLAETPGLRIALVGPTDDEVRAVMVEGSSGLIASASPGARPEWEPSLGRLTWPSGSRAFVYSAANPEALRGPEHDFAWCDEIAKWPRGEAAWDNLMFGLRRGARPKALATTTPRPVPLLRRLVDRDGRPRAGVVLRRGRTADNVVLARSFLEAVTGLYGGTRLGRQELDGELIEEVEGSLWPRAMIEASRHSGTLPRAGLKRVVVGVDPPISSGGDACGIVVCAAGEDGMLYVLADASVGGLRPEGWARAVAHAAATWDADRVIAEGNQGGQMVESVLRTIDTALPVRIVHARHGKSARAEPVASLFERGGARFAGAFPELEDQLAGMTIAGAYEGPGRSPDRADAMVWAMTELMKGEVKREPRVRRL